MSVRGVWVILDAPDQQPTVLYSRRYPTVERRARKFSPDPSAYFPLPGDRELCGAAMQEVCSVKESNQKNASIRACDKSWSKPVYELFDGKVWPVVLIQQKNLYFLSIPLLEQRTGGERPPLLDIPAIPLALELLISMTQVLSSSSEKSSLKGQFPSPLHQFLSVSVPLGTILDTNVSQYNSLVPILTEQTPPCLLPDTPSWKPVLFKGNPKLSLTVLEQVQLTQWDPRRSSVSWNTYGSVLCKADLEGVPDVSLNLVIPQGGLNLRTLHMHPCVHLFDVQSSTPEPEAETANRPAGPLLLAPTSTSTKLRFSPPLGLFSLCKYACSERNLSVHPEFVPIKAIYEMVGSRKVELLVHLKLSERVKNSFEVLEVSIPLFNRGPIQTADIHPSSMQVSISPDQRKLIWNVDKKFPKSLEQTLRATVTFLEDSNPPSVQGEDPFCVGQTAYILISFRIFEFTLSGLSIEPRSILSFPQSKYKLAISREFSSAEYKVWNVNGDALIPEITHD